MSYAVAVDIDTLAKSIEAEMLRRAEENWTDFIDSDGEIWIDEDSAFEAAFHQIGGDQMPTGEYELVYEQVQNHPGLAGVYGSMRKIVTESAEDQREYVDSYQSVYARLRYHGMSVHDFI